jgi:hypothetical protein
MSRLLLLSLLAAGLYSCTDSVDTHSTRTDEVTTAAAAEQDELDWKENAFPELLRALESGDTTFTLNSFATDEAAAPPNTDTKAYPMEGERLVPFQALFVYNSDSTKAIDLFSYNYMANSRNGRPVMVAGEPDTEVALLDYQNKTRKRLLFLGPSFAALDARWLSNNEVAIAGAEIVGEELIKPIVWKITLPDGGVETEFYTDTVHANLSAIREQRFKSVKFQSKNGMEDRP